MSFYNKYRPQTIEDLDNTNVRNYFTELFSPEVEAIEVPVENMVAQLIKQCKDKTAIRIQKARVLGELSLSLEIWEIINHQEILTETARLFDLYL